ncbi:MAG: hypothetical protein LQ343_005723 [Gyalolechia ehrenbergii]|nr:MAG: hypothetical protein LQ343_005723 [Gyalolechia ehrenbergii]
MADPLDKVLDTNIFNLEWMAGQRQDQATPETLGQLLETANDFLALRETMSPMGTTFVDRLTKAFEKIEKLLPDGDLIGLEDFINRQKLVTLEADLGKLKESIQALEVAEKEAGNTEAPAAEQDKVPVYEITSPPESPTFTFPLAVEILNVNTGARMLASKDDEKPFVLKFFEECGRYQVIDPWCGAHGEDNLVHFFIDPGNVGFVAWAPKSTFIHTQTENYRKCESGDFCNIELRDVEGLEDLLEHMKGRGISVQKVPK